MRMRLNNVGRSLIHRYNSDDDIIIIPGYLITSLPSTSDLLSLHDPTVQGYGENEVRGLNIQYVLCLINGNYFSCFVSYKDHMS